MSQIRRNCWRIAAVAVFVGLPLGCYNFILDWRDKPWCHKQFMMAFLNWMDANGMDCRKQINPFPNVEGNSRDSLNAIKQEMGGEMGWARDYGYVPGLRQDDPGNLVLMYFNRPTRWTLHVSAPTIFQDKEWILIPVDFCFFGNRQTATGGELSERVTTEEFKRRLRETIAYIRAQARPNWQAIVAEQTKFLDSIDSAGR